MSDAPIKGGRFQIWLRRRQLQANYPPPDGTFQNVIVQCDPLTGAAQYLPGAVDNSSDFAYPNNSDDDVRITPVNGWYDFSNWIEGEEKLSFDWDKVNQGDSQAVNKDGSNYDKGVTSDLIFRDAAFRFIYLWLLANECQILNFVEVKIIDLISRGNGGAASDPAGNYRIFEIKSDNLEYAPIDLPCVFVVKLREQDERWHCIHKTVIWDNWQGWFGGEGTPGTREFPQFFTCIEPRPRLLSSARMGLMLFWESLIVDGIPLLQALLFFLNKEGLVAHARRILNANKFVDAPQVYDYILNVAMKCDMAIDTVFDPNQPLNYVCVYFPSAGQMKEFEGNDDPVETDLSFIYDNRWLVTLADLLDKLKVVFAAEWYVTPNNTIVFKFIKDLIQLAPIYDYTASGAVPIYGLKYSFNGDKKPAYGRYQYTDDGSDLASQEMDTLYNDIVDFDGSAFNPMLEGDKTKNFEFAPTGFVGDGRSKNYLKLLIRDAEIVALVLAAILVLAFAAAAAAAIASITGAPEGLIIAAIALIWVTLIIANRKKLQNEFVTNPGYKGAVRLTCEQVMTPRLLLWDGVSKNKAMVDARVGLPVPFPYYNPTNIPYNVVNQISIDNDGNPDNGAFGVYNYPLYFDSMFYDNLFLRYHDVIDNPLKSIETHQTATFYVDLCADQLNLYGVFQNQYAQIGKIVKVEEREGYDVFVRIGHINPDYGSNQIVISGTVIRKPTSQIDDLTPGNIPVVTPEESGYPPTPTQICYKWKNVGTAPLVVTYIDCSNTLVAEEVILQGEAFCAFDVIDVQPEFTLILTDSCEPIPSGSASASGSVPVETPDCFRFVNGSPETSTVSYIDCDGNLVAGVEVPFMGSFCAREIVNSRCGFIQNTGSCVACEPCCLPTINSVEVSNESSCVPVVEPDPFVVFDAITDSGYNYNYDIPASYPTEPISVIIIDVPAWMTVTVVDDGGGVFFVNLAGSPTGTDAGTDIPVHFIVENACGSFEIDQTIDVVDLSSFIYTITEAATTGEEPVRYVNLNSIDFSSQSGYIVWGDGVIEAFTLPSLGSVNLFHIYPAQFTSYTSVVYFNVNAGIFLYNDVISGGGSPYHDITFFTHSVNFTNFNFFLTLSGVMDTSTVMPPNPDTKLKSIDFIGSPNSTQTSIDLSSMDADIVFVEFESFPLITEIVGVDSTAVWQTFIVHDCPVLSDIHSSLGTIPDTQTIAITNNNSGSPMNIDPFVYNSTTYMSMTPNFSTSDVNTFLIGLDGNGLSGGNCLFNETPAAPPSGAGATAKTNLIGKGWTVTTD